MPPKVPMVTPPTERQLQYMHHLHRITEKHGRGPTVGELAKVVDRAPAVVRTALRRMQQIGVVLEKPSETAERFKADGTSAGARWAGRWTVTAAGHRWLEAGSR